MAARCFKNGRSRTVGKQNRCVAIGPVGNASQCVSANEKNAFCAHGDEPMSID